MGNMCTSSHITRENGGMMNWPSTTKVIRDDGKVQEFKDSIKASYILSRNPNYFLCSSESMYIDSCAQQVPMDDMLQLRHIYFLIPSSKSCVPFSLHDLCSLAIKASTALEHTGRRGKIIGVKPYQDCKVQGNKYNNPTHTGLKPE
ncbi:hypothetical protein DCAR_0103852 [Daucus carota subsp. sativus]|uniref:Uncharacterized protein n=2 Tax=Daucus carota subsp. sativus TaxID=79200 RepID=A0AAF0WAP1_DAUCS|nr:hypothetical protein DCAR_0103852 [Daucus carota subsp. sativus]